MGRIADGKPTGQRSYETPRWFVERVADRLGIHRFDVDVCATASNTKAGIWFGPGSRTHQDALAPGCNWGPFDFVWMNPPYGRGIHRWCRKAGGAGAAGPTVVGLLPGGSWDAAWWHAFVLGEAIAGRCVHELHPIAGRIQFELDGAPQKAPASGNIVVVWRPGIEPRAPVIVLPGISTKPPRAE